MELSASQVRSLILDEHTILRDVLEEIDAGKIVLAMMAGRLRRNRIRVMTGDRVSLELSPYDLTKGRITYRMK